MCLFILLKPCRSVAAAVSAQGTQFITGPCKSDADCASGCCGFNTGKCAGAVIAQERDGGCGFGDQFPNNNAAQKIQGPNAEAAPGVPKGGVAAPAAPAAPATAPGTQFITGACKSDADCASGCCGFNTGKCAGPVVAQDRDGGCGFGDAVPNNNAARLIQGPNASKAPGVPRSIPSTLLSGAAAKREHAEFERRAAFTLQNGKDAKALNAKFKTLTESSSCKSGENACVKGKFAQCANGKFVTFPCNGGLVCTALPLVNSPGTSIVCDTAADAQARIAATGA
jgi:hypothetical protein